MRGSSVKSGQKYLRFAAAAWLAGVACMAHGASVDPLNIPDTQLEPVKWADLDGWEADDQAAAFAAFLASCKPFLAIERPRDPRPIYDGLLHACRRAATTKPASATEARKFFEENFRPVRIARRGESTGLLTGYYMSKSSTDRGFQILNSSGRFIGARAISWSMARSLQAPVFQTVRL